eukprot:Nk52_evm9s374 gene=Nk52_evmTU9s374
MGGALQCLNEIEIALVQLGRGRVAKMPDNLRGCLEELIVWEEGEYMCEEIKSRSGEVNSILLNLIKVLERVEGDGDVVSEAYDKAAEIMANLSGPCSERNVHNEYQIGEICMRLRDSDFAAADVGWKLWPSGRVLCDLMLDEEVNVKGKRVLEIGCGIGLCSIFASKLDAASVVATDFLPSIVSNLRHNLKLNDCEEVIKAMQLDWNEYEKLGRSVNEEVDGFERKGKNNFFDDSELCQCNYDLIIASDVIYEDTHARMLPKMLEMQIVCSAPRIGKKTEVVIVLPLPKYRDGVHLFHGEMTANGFCSVGGYPRTLNRDPSKAQEEEEQAGMNFSETSFTVYRYYHPKQSQL